MTKKRLFRRKRTWLIIILLLLIAPVIYSWVMMNQFAWTEKEIADYFSDKAMKPDFSSYETGGKKIFYASIGNDTMPMILFIHGAPGSWYDYIKYFGDSNLVSRSHLVSPDRPGYGNSGNGEPVTSIEQQAAMIRQLLNLNKSKEKVILVGHSYGGPIALRMGMDYPDDIRAMVLLAPAIDPDNEKQFGINKIAGWKPVQWLLPKMWYTAYFEKKSHVDELRKFNHWEKITAPVVYMFGNKDEIVPPVNVEYARKKITNAPLSVIEFPEENHFIPWTQQDSVTKVILRLLEQ